jgi:xanthine dehydrogenase YagR molybdenum-binding subunit
MSTTVTGKPTDRVDGRLKVTGQARYAAEYPAAHIAHAYLVQSTISKGRITDLDTRAAEAAPGVLAVLTHRNAPAMKATEVFDPASHAPKAGGTSVDILRTDRIWWHGQPIAVVVAETFEQAQYAASLVRAGYAEEPARVALRGQEGTAYPPDNVLGEPTVIRRGDAEAALAKAAVKVDHEYTTPRENHNPIEPHATTAVWEGDRLTVYDASQYIFGVRQMLAEKFGIPQENVRVLAPYVGGGFGSKGLAWPHVALAVAAAKAIGRPVKLPLTRAQMYGCVGYRSPTEQRVALGANRDGRLTALIQTGVSQTATSGTFTEMFSFPARHLYASPNVYLGQKLVQLDVVPPTFMRAPGESPGTFALESALDELAHALNMDPVELRSRNEPDKDPTTGLPFSNRNLKEAYALGAEKFGWARRNPRPGSMRDGRFLVGMGVATAIYPYYRFPASARVRVRADGTELVQSGAQEMGMGTATVHTLLVAELLGLPLDRVRAEHGDTNLPFAAVAGGSTTTVSAGSAIQAACTSLKAELLKLAQTGDGPLRGAKAEDVEFRDGGLFLKGDPRRGETYQALLARHGRNEVEARADTRPGDEMQKYAMFSYGAQFCEVRVDPDLGEVRVSRFIGVFDSGRILNPKTARSQFLGGITMGLGMALMEETHVDGRNGRVVNASLAEYLVPVHLDVPAIEAYWLDKPDPQAPLGAHGIGEIGITGVAAVVANAVFHATGKRIRDLPITPEKLL